MKSIKERKPQKERVDKTKNKIKVIKELLKNPLQTEREIAKNAKISKSSAHNHAKDIGQNWPKSDIIDEIIKNDAKIVELTQAEIKRRINEEPDKVSTRDLISAWDVSAKRYSIFKWDITDKEWGLKSISDINITIWS